MRISGLLAAIVFALSAHAQDASQPKFQVASIQPNHSGDSSMGITIEPGGRFVADNATAKMLVTVAYRLRDDQVSGLPKWAESEHFDISAKPPVEGEVRPDQVRAMLRSLLAERFHLVLHTETRDLPGYALVVAKDGPKMKPSNAAAPESGGEPQPQVRGSRGDLTAENVTMDTLADDLSDIVEKNVVDKTGLTGRYDFHLAFMPQRRLPPGTHLDTTGNSNAPSIFTAVQEQLGLKLEEQRGPVEIFLIDKLEKPAEN